MSALLLALLLVGPALGASKGPGWEISVETVPEESPAEEVIPSSTTAAQLAYIYVTSFRPRQKEEALELLGRTKPAGLEDLRALLDLYSREDPAARGQVESSLRQLGPEDRRLGGYFVELLRNEDAFLRMFGLIGAFQVRADGALPLIRELASRRFAHRQVSLALAPAESNEWQLQLAALQVLALWTGREALPLLEERSKEAPAAASIMASLFWEEVLPRVVQWSESRRAADQERAGAAWRAVVAPESLAATAPALKALVLDRKKRKETRQSAAIKLGLAADPALVGELLEEHAKARDKDTRLLLAAALFASRDPRVIPMLEELARKGQTPDTRAGALAQLRSMLPWEAYSGLLRWVSQNDADGGNREEALRQLSEGPPKAP